MNSNRRRIAAIVLTTALLGFAAGLGMREKPFDAEDADPISLEPIDLPSLSTASSLPELPESDLRAAMTDLCSADNQRQIPMDIQPHLKAFNDLKQSLSERLSVSSSTEHLHLAALLDGNSESRVKLIERAMSQNTTDAFLLWGAVQICADSGASTSCRLRDWEKQLIEIDGQNSESWIRIAANRYQDGDLSAALEAMRHAATAAETRAYWTETIELIERGLAAGSDYSFPERAGMAFGIAASERPRYGDYVTMCKEQSAESVDWTYACLAYGELVENQGKTEMGVAIGRSIRKLALEALGELENAAAVEQQLQARRQERLKSIGDYDAVIERLIISNPTLFTAYLAAVRSQGEVAARDHIETEIERLLEQQPELVCEPF